VDASERPDDAHAQMRLAVGLYAVGERAGAVAALERAAALAPGWALPQRNLAVVHRQRGQLAAADEAARRADALERGRP
jgi:Flp pilus assembly protein TadD